MLGRAVLAALASAVTLAACTADLPRGRATYGPATPGTMAPSPRVPRTPEGLHLELEEAYAVGEQAEVRLHNDSETPYRYNAEYQACELTYRDSSGREFIIPPGTHCDLVLMRTIAPGETVTLFTWDLDECTKDRWGCVRSRPLRPGTYTISGTFKSSGVLASRVEVSATFRIVRPTEEASASGIGA